MSPKELMRSRYSAYALDLGNYIIQTSHPDLKRKEKEEKLWLEEIHHFSKTTDFVGLVIEEEGTLNEVRAFVTFTALLKQGGQLTRMKEKSFFEYQGDQWLYHSGQVDTV